MFDKLWGRGLSLLLFAATRANQAPPPPDVHSELFDTLRDASPEEAQQAMIEHVREGLARQIKGL